MSGETLLMFRAHAIMYIYKLVYNVFNMIYNQIYGYDKNPYT